MNNKGFSLIELLGALAILATILCIGLYSARGTLATTMTMMDNVSKSEIVSASESYVLENGVTWMNDGEEYTCLLVSDLVDAGYFEKEEVTNFKDNKIKLVRDVSTKVVSSVDIVDDCE